MKKLLGILFIAILSIGVINNNFSEQVGNESEYPDSSYEYSLTAETFSNESEYPDWINKWIINILIEQRDLGAVLFYTLLRNDLTLYGVH